MGKGYYKPIQQDFIHEKKRRLYACDFETTTESYSTTETKVWSFCYDEIGKYNPEILGSIEDFYNFAIDPEKGVSKVCYFHNLKFDGMFILDYLLRVRQFKTIINPDTGTMEKPKNLLNGEMVYIIDEMGKWFYVAFKDKNVLCECRDSLKILPFTLKQIGEAFCKTYKKSTMEYDNKFSLDDCSEDDIQYIKNDVLVLSEALSFIMKQNGEESPFDPILSLTIGGACYQQFKSTIYGDNKNIAIKAYEEDIPVNSGSDNMDEYIRKSYRGGYCYVNGKVEGKLLETDGFTADVNSLYPFVMCTEYSGNKYPYGKGVYHDGKPPERFFISDDWYFFIRIRVSFILKEGYVPTIQIKGNFFYKSTMYLRSSRAVNFRTNEEVGELKEVILTLTKEDYILFTEHYNIISIEYLDYIGFSTAPYIFDEYIKKYAKIKQESKGATRSLAKLFQNNLYGQMSKSMESSFKMVSGFSGGLEFTVIDDHSKVPVNIAIGSAITAKARFYQINTIQANLDRFCYSDTDSLHCIGNPSDFIGKTDDKIYGAYKIEGEWTRAIFLRQKTYIEDLKTGEWNICCAGMTPVQKEKFRKDYDFTDFKAGLTIHGGKLLPEAVKGGVILREVDFTIK